MTDATLNAPWHIAENFLATFVAFFALPEGLAKLGMIDRRFRDALRDWLRAGETLVRRLLLIEAARCPIEAETESASSRLRRMPCKRSPPLPRFRVFIDGPAIPALRSLPKSRLCAPPRGMFLTASFAKRADALFHVVKNRSAFAQRLARKLRLEPLRAFAFARFDAKTPGIVGFSDFAATAAPLALAIRAIGKPPPPPD